MPLGPQDLRHVHRLGHEREDEHDLQRPSVLLLGEHDEALGLALEEDVPVPAEREEQPHKHLGVASEQLHKSVCHELPVQKRALVATHPRERRVEKPAEHEDAREDNEDGHRGPVLHELHGVGHLEAGAHLRGAPDSDKRLRVAHVQHRREEARRVGLLHAHGEAHGRRETHEGGEGLLLRARADARERVHEEEAPCEHVVHLRRVHH
mmetsp:Transcript_15922/g.42866  ORF Transcript_15922/g.42866 Transcript_15922/m.42866 type:complete len:208 (-) Transcript_15922:151-774(-)